MDKELNNAINLHNEQLQEMLRAKKLERMLLDAFKPLSLEGKLKLIGRAQSMARKELADATNKTP